MALLLYVTILLSVYIASFKSDFSDENITKILPVLVPLVVLIILGVVFTLLK